jgi:hypothetical protein
MILALHPAGIDLNSINISLAAPTVSANAVGPLAPRGARSDRGGSSMTRNPDPGQFPGADEPPPGVPDGDERPEKTQRKADRGNKPDLPGATRNRFPSYQPDRTRA